MSAHSSSDGVLARRRRSLRHEITAIVQALTSNKMPSRIKDILATQLYFWRFRPSPKERRTRVRGES
ncbi:hypothetical protein ACEYW6_34600 [Nostoc sp. UIC 10607]|uniref:hypothetical protein n=1 Tax=Nostoc sp. UIC 10607 TaxID=3045935 RepID=UPI00399F3901